jgi:acetolactate synthase-1/2/3 large subunit
VERVGQIDGGELFVKAMAAEGIRFLFGLPSPTVDPILSRLEDNDIRFVPIHHESAALHMAEGLYKTTGQASAVIANPGPGSANLIPGVITARHEGVPVLVITSQHRLGVVYPSPPTTFQGQDQIEAFAAAVKWGAPILQWDRTAEVMRLAFREMWNGRPGPVQVDIPAPILYEVGDESAAPVRAPEAYRASSPQASAAQIGQAVELLAGAKRPVLIPGAGADHCGAHAEILEIAETLGCPVVPTMAGRATISMDHPNYVFGFGDAGITARKEADVILVAGSRLGNLDLPYDKYWGDGEDCSLIQIDTDPLNIGVSRPITLGMVADARDALAGIAAGLKERGIDPKDREDLDRYQRLDREWHEAQFGVVAEWDGPGIHPGQAIEKVGEVFGDQAIYTVDGGNTALWAYSLLPSTPPRSYHSILELGMLGTGIPSAIGAKFGEPGREVVCVTGDGAAGFNIMEMQTAVHQGTKVTTVVMAEGNWTMEEPNQLALYGRTFGTEIGPVRWDTVAEGLGCHGEHVDSLEEIEPALRRARESDLPAVVAIHTSADANRAIPAEMVGRFFEVYSGPLA